MRISIEFEPDFIPVNLMRETARYLNALADQKSIDQKSDETPIEVELTSSSPELDSAGDPWDARIHSSKKTKTADGRWKLMRGADPAMVSKLRASEVETTPLQAAPPPPPQRDAAQDTHKYNDLVNKIAALTLSGKLSHMQVLEILRSEQLENLPALAAHPELIDTVSKKILGDQS